MDMVTIAASAYALGLATAAAVMALHHRSVRMAVEERKAEDARALKGMQERLETAEARAENNVALAQHRQLQDVYTAGYVHGYQVAWGQRTVSNYRREGF